MALRRWLSVATSLMVLATLAASCGENPTMSSSNAVAFGSTSMARPFYGPAASKGPDGTTQFSTSDLMSAQRVAIRAAVATSHRGTRFFTAADAAAIAELKYRFPHPSTRGALITMPSDVGSVLNADRVARWAGSGRGHSQADPGCSGDLPTEPNPDAPCSDILDYMNTVVHVVKTSINQGKLADDEISNYGWTQDAYDRSSYYHGLAATYLWYWGYYVDVMYDRGCTMPQALMDLMNQNANGSGGS